MDLSWVQVALYQTGEQVEQTSQKSIFMRSERLQAILKASHDFLDGATGKIQMHLEKERANFW